MTMPYQTYLQTLQQHHKDQKHVSHYLQNYLKQGVSTEAIQAYPDHFQALPQISQEGMNDNQLVKWIMALFETVKNAIAKLFKSMIELASKFFQFVKNLVTRGRKIAETLKDESTIAKNIEHQLREEVKQAAEVNPDSKDMDLAKRTVALYAIYGYDTHIVSGLNNSQLHQRLQDTSFNLRDLKRIGQITSYTFRVEDMVHLDYLSHVQPLTKAVPDYHAKLNNYYYRLASLAASTMGQAQVLECFISIIQKHGTDVKLEVFAKEFSNTMLEPFNTYKALTENTISSEACLVQTSGSIKDIKEQRKGKVALQQARQLLFPDITKNKETIGRNPTSIRMPVMIQYANEVNKVMGTISINHKHLFPQGSDRVAGFQISKEKLNKLLKDLKLEKRKDAKKLGETIIGLIREVNMFVVKAHNQWLMVSGRQLSQLNRELVLLKKAKPMLN